MASAQLQTILEMLKHNPISGDTVLEMRDAMAAGAAGAPPPENVVFTAVDAGGVPAEWNDAEGVRQDHVLIYYHGGGYCMGSLDTHRGLTGLISKLAHLRVLAVDYRLAPESPHPAAVEDGLAAYRFLLDQGIDPERVALAGDSAGGGLALATLLSIRNLGLPMPACAVGISAWTDLTVSGDSIKTKASIDPMLGDLRPLHMMIEAYLAEDGDPKDPLTSPLFANLAGLPPLLLQVGTAEVLLDDTTRIAARAEAAGVDVTLRVWDDMFHVWHVFAEMLPEAMQATQELADFVNARMSGDE